MKLSNHLREAAKATEHPEQLGCFLVLLIVALHSNQKSAAAVAGDSGISEGDKSDGDALHMLCTTHALGPVFGTLCGFLPRSYMFYIESPIMEMS